MASISTMLVGKYIYSQIQVIGQSNFFLEATLNRMKTVPASLEASLAFPERFLSLPSQTIHIQTLNEGFQVPLQGREGDIGEYNANYFDSQEATLLAFTSNCDDLEEHEFHEEDYESDDSMGLEECWWPQECLYSVESFKKKLHLKGRKKKRRKGSERIASPFQTTACR
jgi:hypothetical protein